MRPPPKERSKTICSSEFLYPHIGKLIFWHRNAAKCHVYFPWLRLGTSVATRCLPAITQHPYCVHMSICNCSFFAELSASHQQAACCSQSFNGVSYMWLLRSRQARDKADALYASYVLHPTVPYLSLRAATCNTLLVSPTHWHDYAAARSRHNAVVNATSVFSFSSFLFSSPLFAGDCFVAEAGYECGGHDGGSASALTHGGNDLTSYMGKKEKYGCKGHRFASKEARRRPSVWVNRPKPHFIAIIRPRCAVEWEKKCHEGCWKCNKYDYI